MTFRTLLFVPGHRPDRFDKAVQASPVVCIDLEDAVPPDQKDTARAAVCEWLRRVLVSSTKIGVRINHPATPEGQADAAALSRLKGSASALPKDEGRGTPSPTCAFLMIPKVAAAADLAVLNGPALWPIVESGMGLKNAWEIAAAPAVQGVLFGGADFSADIGATMAWESLLYARGRLAAACGTAGVELMDVPYLDINDTDGLIASTQRAKALGFTGRACIHPTQVAPVLAAFAPSEAEMEWAHRVIAALKAAGGQAALLDGKLIEKPVILAAHRILERAGGK